jgi:hypothetical protein
VCFFIMCPLLNPRIVAPKRTGGVFLCRYHMCHMISLPGAHGGLADQTFASSMRMILRVAPFFDSRLFHMHGLECIVGFLSMCPLLNLRIVAPNRMGGVSLFHYHMCHMISLPGAPRGLADQTFASSMRMILRVAPYFDSRSFHMHGLASDEGSA